MNKRQNPRTAGEKFQSKSALYEHVRDMLLLERICTRLHLVAKQLEARHADRETFHVKDEYDLCDLLRALLTVEHDNIRAETWIPDYANGNPRTDFVLTIEKVILEAKMAQENFGAKELEEQLAADIRHYERNSDCETLVYFIYDPEGRIANPRLLENNLSKEQDRLTVRVIIAPKHP